LNRYKAYVRPTRSIPGLFTKLESVTEGENVQDAGLDSQFIED
jgi:hypothetical protein